MVDRFAVPGGGEVGDTFVRIYLFTLIILSIIFFDISTRNEEWGVRFSFSLSFFQRSTCVCVRISIRVDVN